MTAPFRATDCRECEARRLRGLAFRRRVAFGAKLAGLSCVFASLGGMGMIIVIGLLRANRGMTPHVSSVVDSGCGIPHLQYVVGADAGLYLQLGDGGTVTYWMPDRPHLR